MGNNNPTLFASELGVLQRKGNKLMKTAKLAVLAQNWKAGATLGRDGGPITRGHVPRSDVFHKICSISDIKLNHFMTVSSLPRCAETH